LKLPVQTEICYNNVYLKEGWSSLQVIVRVFGGLESYMTGNRFGRPIPVTIKEGFTGRMLI